MIAPDHLGTGIGMSMANMRLLCGLIILAARAAKGLVGLAWRGLQSLGTPGGTPRLATLETALLRHGGCSSRTIAVYMRSLDRLLSWGDGTGTCVTTPEGISDYIASSEASGAHFGTLRLHLAAARKIFDEALGLQATDGLHYPPRPDPVQAVSAEVVAILFDAAETTRERLLLLLLNHSELRPGQIRDIHRTDIDLDTARLSAHGKGQRWAEPVQLPPPIVFLLRRLLRQEPQTAYVFSSPRSPSRPVSVRTIQTNLARIASRCGVTATCTAVRRASSVLRVGAVSVGIETTVDPRTTVVMPAPTAEPQTQSSGSSTRNSKRACRRRGRQFPRTRRQDRSKVSRRESTTQRLQGRASRAPPFAS